MTILADYKVIGDELWLRFSAGNERQMWWYREGLKVTQKRIPDMSLNAELEGLVGEFEGI